jgi:peptidoglycan-associated lipoprotein
MKRTTTATLVFLAALTSACHRQKNAAPAPVTDRPQTMPASPLPPAPLEKDAEREAREKRELELRNTTTALLAEIHFEFDEYDLDDEARAVLEQKLHILNDNPAVRIRAIGHADERGSDEYNLALGQRRAAAAKRFLSQNGIDPVRVEIVSVGEEKAVCVDASESCWSRNRRAAFELIEGQVTSALR